MLRVRWFPTAFPELDTLEEYWREDQKDLGRLLPSTDHQVSEENTCKILLLSKRVLQPSRH
jgi:hypothetical protein